MGAESISYFSILTLLVLIIPIIIINYKLQMKINKKTIYSIVRMIIQLSLVGIFLQYIFDLDNRILNMTYVVLMIFIASFSVTRTCGLQLKQFFFPLLMAFLIPSIVIVLFFNSLVIELENVFMAQYVIPIGGMVLGNSLSGNIVCINSFYKAIKTSEKEYLYTLSLSGNKIESLLPFFKDAISSSISPTIASMETIGLVALPGMMTGQILGGSIPITAIKYQIAIMLAIFICRYFSAILSIIFTINFAFDEYDVLTVSFK